MSLKLGDTFPDKKVKTSTGIFTLYEYFGDSWGIFFSHPADFTPVCTTELQEVACIQKKFTDRNVKMIAISCDSVESHIEWIKDVDDYGTKTKVDFPIIEDTTREFAEELGMLDPAERTSTGLPLTARAVFIIAPDKTVKLSILYPASTGRNFDEILRVIDSLQLTANYKVATPANWKNGEQCMILPSVTDEEAIKLFSTFTTVEVKSKRPYMRLVADPSCAPKKADDKGGAAP